MDWLRLNIHAVIVGSYEKLVRVLILETRPLIFLGDGSNNGHESRLNIISCTKTQKYLLEGCPIFLAQVTMKKAEDKSKEKQLEEVPIVQGLSYVARGTLSTGSIRDEGVVGPIKRTFRQRLYKTQFLTLGSSGLVCQEERWIIPDVH
ncbi:hypothetical protein Tco_0452587 [Tanacetum coccineum]